MPPAPPTTKSIARAAAVAAQQHRLHRAEVEHGAGRGAPGAHRAVTELPIEIESPTRHTARCARACVPLARPRFERARDSADGYWGRDGVARGVPVAELAERGIPPAHDVPIGASRADVVHARGDLGGVGEPGHR